MIINTPTLNTIYKSILKNDILICGMTTWKERINYIECPLWHICKQVLQPDIFYLVLSEVDFPNKEADLPQFIFSYLKKYSFFKILWVKDNIKQFKKNIPILKKHWNDNIVYYSLDDDVLYDKYYLYKTYRLFSYFNKTDDTIITYNFGWPSENPIWYDINYKRVIGKFEILKPSFFKNKNVLDITEDDIKNSNNWISEDWWITYNLRKNKELAWKFINYKFLNNLYKNYYLSNKNPLLDIYVEIKDKDKFKNIIKLYNSKFNNK